MDRKCRVSYMLVVTLVALAATTHAQQRPERLEFTRMVAHWAEYSDAGYLDFIDDAQPELVQLGFYGAHFWSLAHTPQYKGYPAHFPLQGLNQCGQWFEEKNRELHRRGVKVIGHFNVEFLVGDPDGPDGPRGFFKFYRDLWDEKELGKRPVADPLDLLEKDADGVPITQAGYGIGGMREYWGCLRNPHWQTVLKAWLRRGVERGVDGFIANYFYRHNCLCEHCQSAFRSHLKERFTADELKSQFGIADLDRHKFDEIVSWHAPQESTPLRREMLRFSQVSNKQVFDEVFNRYGRSLKPDLIVAQWNHLGNFTQISGDERCMLPENVWGHDEDYLWYSAGASACFTDLEVHHLGDVTLQARYIRGAFDDKPFTIGKYENTRIRSAIAELAANGGSPMGFYTRFTDPAARAEIVRYYQFLKRFDEIYRANRPHAEVALIFPRSRIQQGDIEALNTFRQMGKSLLEFHVLFDVLPDDLATPESTAKYKHIFRTGNVRELGRDSLQAISNFEAPHNVIVSASRPMMKRSVSETSDSLVAADELTIHFVNYNREEPPRKKDGSPSPGGGIKDEKPLAVSGIQANVVLPAGYRARYVEAISPEQPDAVALELRQSSGRVQFTMPEFLVYGVARIKLERTP